MSLPSVRQCVLSLMRPKGRNGNNNYGEANAIKLECRVGEKLG